MEKKRENRMYSLNLAAYVIMKTNGYVDYEIKLDEENGTCYYVFREDISDIIQEYKVSEIQKFLDSYRMVRNDIKAVREATKLLQNK